MKLYLLLSVLALASGPVLAHWGERTQAVVPVLRGLVLVGLGGLVLAHVLPHAVDLAGPLAIGLALLGVLLPIGIERLSARRAGPARAWIERLAALGLAGHAFLDGAGLAAASGPSGATGLALAIVLHRVPVSLFLWWLVRSERGPRAAMLVLLALALLTWLGAAAGEMVVLGAGGPAIGLLTAFLAGLLLHVLFGHRLGPSAREPRLETAGGLLGLAVVAFAPSSGHGLGSTYGDRFVALALETAPVLVLGYALAGVVGVFLPQASLQWASRGGPLGRAARGVLFGLPLPICSCGVVPVYRGLVTRGLPPTAGLAFLVATPELGVESVLLSFPLLGAELTGVRLAAAALAALIIGVWVGRGLPSLSPTPDAVPITHRRSLLNRGKAAVAFGFGEVVEHTALWIVVGLAVAAATEPAALGPLLEPLPAGADVVAFALAGMPMYVCASGATPLAAALIAAGASPGAALAFLLSGPATNLTTVGVLSQLHGRRAALSFAGSLLAVSVGLGWLLNLVWPASATVPAVGLTEDGPSALQVTALVVLGIAVFAALLRRGPQGLVATLWESSEAGEHDHAKEPHSHPCCPTPCASGADFHEGVRGDASCKLPGLERAASAAARPSPTIVLDGRGSSVPRSGEPPEPPVA